MKAVKSPHEHSPAHHCKNGLLAEHFTALSETLQHLLSMYLLFVGDLLSHRLFLKVCTINARLPLTNVAPPAQSSHKCSLNEQLATAVPKKSANVQRSSSQLDLNNSFADYTFYAERIQRYALREQAAYRRAEAIQRVCVRAALLKISIKGILQVNILSKTISSR